MSRIDWTLSGLVLAAMLGGTVFGGWVVDASVEYVGCLATCKGHEPMLLPARERDCQGSDPDGICVLEPVFAKP